MSEEKDPELVLIGQRFKKFRKDNNITQDDLNEVAAVVVLSRIENGHRMPNVEILTYIAKKYKADINWILTGDASKKAANENAELIARLTSVEVRLKMIEKKL